MRPIDEWFLDLWFAHRRVFETFEEIDMDLWYIQESGEEGLICFPGWLLKLETALCIRYDEGDE